jgi:HlyD family secretion protein
MKRRIIYIVIAVLVILSLIAAFKLRGNGDGETVVVTLQDLVQTVELSGKVVPKEEVDLAFEIGGTVAFANKKVGDSVFAGEAIAQLDQTKVRADLSKAEADLAAARAGLSDNQTTLDQNLENAYISADDAIHNKVDQFFEDGTSRGPEILNSFEGFDLRKKINEDRVMIEDMLTEWKTDTGDLSKTKGYLQTLTAFLNEVSVAVNKFETNPNLSQTTIDKYRADMATARQNINNASASLISGTAVESAKILAAEATVSNYKATLSKMVLRSPISGVVSKQDAKAGEAVSANTVVASVISRENQIEAYVPEISFAGIALGNRALVTLDAYGDSKNYEATISKIDPRETVRDGVSTYKIELKFTKAYTEVRSGMTANIHIETGKKENSLVIPLRAIISEGTLKTVSVLDENGDIEKREIKTGVTDSSGNIEVVFGLVAGDKVLLNPTK